MLAHREKSEHFPEKVVQLPEKNVPLPENDVQLPENEVRLPENEVQLPEKKNQSPEREASVPESGDVFEQVELGGGIKVGPSIQTVLLVQSFKIIPSMLILVQGDTSGCSQGTVDIKTKVPFYYKEYTKMQL